MATRPNLMTTFAGLQLDWRVTEHGDSPEEAGGLEVELLSPVNLTDDEYRQAEEEACEAFDGGAW